MNRKLAAAGAALTAVTLAACSSARTPTESAACATPSNYPGLCGTGSPAAPPPQAAASTGPGSVPVTQTVRQGEVFKMSYTQNGVPTEWQAALDSITCGNGSIFSRSVLTAYYSSMGQPLVIPKPGQGQKFCLVKFAVTNNSDSSQPWGAGDTTVNVGMNAYDSDMNGPGYDAEQAYMQEAQPHGDTSDFGINPGVHAVSWAVFQFPAQDQPTSVGVPDGTGGEALDAEQVLVLLS